MKKIFQLLLVLCLPVAAHAQYFELTPDGFVNASDPSKKYVVLEFPDNDQKQAYDKVDQYFQSVTGKTYDVVRVPNDRISATATEKIEALAGIFKRPYDTQYTLTIRSKTAGYASMLPPSTKCRPRTVSCVCILPNHRKVWMRTLSSARTAK